MDREEEKRLAASAAAGDMDAFEKLVVSNERLVYAVAVRLLKNEQDAQDASQETFIKAYRALPEFKGDSRFSAWLYRLTQNTCIDMLRRKKAREVSLTSCDDGDEAEQLDIADERFSPELVLEKKELRRAVCEGLNALPEKYRRALLLREMAGLSYDEISQAEKLDIGTVKSRIFRARKKLCVILSQDGNNCGNGASKKAKGGA